MATVSNFPRPPTRNIENNSFPQDLRDYYTEISVMKYSSGGSAGAPAGLGGMIKLPLPKRINDVTDITWEEFSLTSMATAIASNYFGNSAGLIQGGLDMIGIDQGIALNPFAFMQFRRPQFKKHVLSWTLMPINQQESDNIRDIVKQLKRASLPEPNEKGMGALMNYPDLLNITLRPNDYMYKFKTCAIQSVVVDYTGSGLSFFESKAPAVVNLTLNLIETKLWQKSDLDQ